MNEITQILDFIVEVEKLKSVIRKTRISEGSHQLWDVLEVQLQQAVKDGLLN